MSMRIAFGAVPSNFTSPFNEEAEPAGLPYPGTVKTQSVNAVKKKVANKRGDCFFTKNHLSALQTESCYECFQSSPRWAERVQGAASLRKPYCPFASALTARCAFESLNVRM